MGGVLTGDPFCAVLPGTLTMQLFYPGSDHAPCTRWRDPDGKWSGEVRMGGVLTSAPTAAQIPGSNILELFYRGSDDALWTRWRNPDGSWSEEVWMGGVLNSDPIVAVSPPPWMSRLLNALKLSQLTLPGTHESCTAGLIPVASAQSWSLQDQLNHGIC
jgi:hypothetical protein